MEEKIDYKLAAEQLRSGKPLFGEGGALAIHHKVKDESGRAISRAIYNVLGVDKEGRKDLLGMYVAKSEGANFWLEVLTSLEKLVWLAYRNICEKWTSSLSNWALISQQLAIKFGNRFEIM